MKGITDNIPQIFYDIIARIIPGAILLWSASVVFTCAGDISLLPDKALAVKSMSFVESVQILLLSYIVSIIINGVYMFIREKRMDSAGAGKEEIDTPAEAPDNIIWSRDIARILKDIKTATTPLAEFIEKGSIEYPSNMIIYDYLRIVRPEIGGRLVKLRAECHMYAILAIGWGILFLIDLVNIFVMPTSGELLVGLILLIATVGISLTLVFQEKRYNKSLKSQWVILKSGIIDKQ